MRRLVVLLALLWVSEGVRFGQLCEGNPNNEIRTSDGHGQGHYGASRGGRAHQGLDVVCADGSAVYAPFDVMLNGKLLVYNDPNKEAIDQGINLSGGGLCFKLFYVRPVKTSGTVSKGEQIGTMLPMQTVYPGITSHVHVQMCDKTDPTPYFQVFGQLCEGNPNNEIRTSDNWGQGHYGASRGGRAHQGLDVVCVDGSAVYAPFDVTLNGKLLVYNNPAKAAIDQGINLSGGGLCFKLFYVRPVKTSGTVRKGEVIGTMLPMQTVYPGITSHVHVQMCDKSDPTPYF